MGVDPAGLEHPRRPPLGVGHVGAGTGVRQPRDRRVAVRWSEVTDVDVACGDGRDDGTQPVASRWTPSDATREEEGAPARVRGAAGLEPPAGPYPGSGPATPIRWIVRGMRWFRRTGGGMPSGRPRRAGALPPALEVAHDGGGEGAVDHDRQKDGEGDRRPQPPLVGE